MIEIPDKYIINPEYVKALEWDIDAYRAALGYPVPGNHTGKLTDGTRPKCGICEAHNTGLSGWQGESGYKEAYYELLLAVQTKHPGESRHQTALRYIRDRETISSDTAGMTVNPSEPGGASKAPVPLAMPRTTPNSSPVTGLAPARTESESAPPAATHRIH